MSKEIKKKIKELDDIKLLPVNGSTYCQYSVLENKLKVLYENQEKILQAIKLLATIKSDKGGVKEQ